MNSKIKNKYELQSKIMKALAHPARLLIVNELCNREMFVCELQKLIGDDISTVSKHLSILKQAGIIENRKEGLRIYYRLKLKCIPMLLSCTENVLLEKTREEIEKLKSLSKT